MGSHSPKDGRRRATAVRALAAGVLSLAVFAVVGAFAWRAATAPVHSIEAGRPTKVTIARGSTTAEIAEQLARAGIIDNPLVFRWKVREAKLDGALRAGRYRLTTGMGYAAAIEALKRGPAPEYVEVVIPEGFTAVRIARRVADKTGIAEAELLELMTRGAPRFVSDYPFLEGAFRDSLEGYLFPATYRIPEGASAERVVRMMLDAFAANFARVDLSYARSRNLTDRDVLIIASIIEREARLAAERPKVASVIYNRLKKRMRLQLCATVLYEMPEGTTRLTYKDLELDSPYNTYRRAGLPPGPISNPGLASLKAAAKPADTDYLYYVLTGEDGSHTFTSSYAEFERAIGRSRELMRN